jgi:hypothetical protein
LVSCMSMMQISRQLQNMPWRVPNMSHDECRQ